MNIITGEKIQQSCDIYLGLQEDFLWNPVIKQQNHKHMDLHDINNNFNNPRLIFCYSHRISILEKKIHFFMNHFILVTHNSDENITNNDNVMNILNCEKLDMWYAQNLCFENDKLRFLPIGIANTQWPHGNLSLFENHDFMKNCHNKTKKVYFNFNIHTNKNKRQICYDSLLHKLEWLNPVSPMENLKRLKDYEFCICPEGNGVDTHRLWEAIYLKTIPIVVKSEFTNILIKNNVPVVVLENWSELDIGNLHYHDYNFPNSFDHTNIFV